ncbi:hypothetical protein [Pseudoxanthomonas sp. LARHCG66]
MGTTLILLTGTWVVTVERREGADATGSRAMSRQALQAEEAAHRGESGTDALTSEVRLLRL